MSCASRIIGTLVAAFVVAGSSFPGGEPARPSLLALLGPSAAYAASDISLANIGISGNGVEIAIPSAAITGSSLPEAELRALFATGAGSLPARLGTLSATRIAIPELTVTQHSGGVRQVTTYFDMELHDVVNGVIGSLRSARSAVTATLTDDSGDKVQFTGTSGETSVEKFDTVLLARLFGGDETDGAARDREQPAQPLHGPFSIKDYRVTGNADDATFSMEIAGIDGEGLSVRPGSTSLSELAGLAEAGSGNFDSLSPDGKRKVLAGLAGLLSGLELGETTASGVTVSQTGAHAKEDNYSLRVDTIRTRFIDRKLGFSFEGITFEGNAGKASVRTFAVEDLSFRSTASALAEAARPDPDNPDITLDNARLAPEGGRLRVENVNVDFNIDDADGKQVNDASGRVAFSIASFTSMTDLVPDGDSAQFETVLDGFHALLPATDNDGVNQLRELGYDEVTLSATARGHWTAEGGRLAVEALSLSGKEIGSIDVRARLGQVDRRAFSGDTDLALQALGKATLHDITLTLENKGLFERIVKRQAADASPDDVKQQFAALATIGIPAVIGDSAAARKIASAVARFANSPGKLALTATAREPAGVGIGTIDFGASEPRAILDRFDISTANE